MYGRAGYFDHRASALPQRPEEMNAARRLRVSAVGEDEREISSSTPHAHEGLTGVRERVRAEVRASGSRLVRRRGLTCRIRSPPPAV
ncbi:Hypothetical protein NTJ_13609 [Nesidiocoris tenuis]|uniref:Uncharacterized protein n=2 Tax=Nesidiocoris tenuis TaxID=355587 RepID=A0ABN7B8T9_9HEMI|nr:Hypothetical protein NTJ_13609 [Nesidiocoris tenuis]